MILFQFYFLCLQPKVSTKVPSGVCVGIIMLAGIWIWDHIPIGLKPLVFSLTFKAVYVMEGFFFLNQVSLL